MSARFCAHGKSTDDKCQECFAFSLQSVRSKIRRGELYLTVGEWLTVMEALDYAARSFVPDRTDLMILPEEITKFLKDNPPPEDAR